MPFEACRRKSKGESLQPHYGHSQPQRKSRKRGCRRSYVPHDILNRRQTQASAIRPFSPALYSRIVQLPDTGKIPLTRIRGDAGPFSRLTIDTGMTIECAVQLIKGGFSFRAGRELGMRSPVWQKGFSDRRITGVDEFERIRNYIHKNPVKQLLVKEAPQYPYSSAHYGFELDPAPVYRNPKLIAAVFRAAKSLPDKASRDAFFS